MKAKFVKKYNGIGFDKSTTHLVYEYRGVQYIISENNAKGNEPLSWQHKTEQDRIDLIKDNSVQKGETVDINDIYELMGWD